MSFFRVGQSQRCSTFTRSLTMLSNLLSLYTFRQEVDSFSAKHGHSLRNSWNRNTHWFNCCFDLCLLVGDLVIIHVHHMVYPLREPKRTPEPSEITVKIKRKSKRPLGTQRSRSEESKNWEKRVESGGGSRSSNKKNESPRVKSKERNNHRLARYYKIRSS